MANKKVEAIVELMNNILEDATVPKNIRKTIAEAKEKIISEEGDFNVNVMTAIYLLDDISNDINMPFHTRTEIWNIVSELEKLKEG